MIELRTLVRKNEPEVINAFEDILSKIESSQKLIKKDFNDYYYDINIVFNSQEDSDYFFNEMSKISLYTSFYRK